MNVASNDENGSKSNEKLKVKTVSLVTAMVEAFIQQFLRCEKRDEMEEKFSISACAPNLLF